MFILVLLSVVRSKFKTRAIEWVRSMFISRAIEENGGRGKFITRAIED